jgi:hypothetical protein
MAEAHERSALQDEPLRGGIDRPGHQLRDPGIHEMDGRLYLLCSVPGEQGIAIADLTL